MSRLTCAVSSILAIALLAVPGAADDEPAEALKQPRIFRAGEGKVVLYLAPEERVIERSTGVRTTADGRTERFSTAKVAFLGQARLVDVDDAGRELERWQATLYDLPQNVLLSDDGAHLVTYDTLDERRGGHELVIYGPRGELLAGYELGEVLSEDELKQHVAEKNPQRLWRRSARIGLDASRGEVVASFAWGKELRFSLKDGKRQ